MARSQLWRHFSALAANLMRRKCNCYCLWVFGWLAGAILMPNITFGQYSHYDLNYFASPVRYPLRLAGSFAELRSTHFHAGIDIKPESSTGRDSIFAAAEGFVSRIKIQTGGYGQALYLDHPNGYTTVYAHLEEFNEKISNYIQNLQINTQSYSLDVYPDSSKFKIEKGLFIGMMGNTGRSYAKHLHFEIRETVTEIPVNPALFGIKPEDERPPVILSFDLHRLSPDRQVSTVETFYPKAVSDGIYQLAGGPIAFPAWQCGIAVQSFDRMNGASNRNGVYYQKLYVDDTLYYSMILEKVSFDESRYINSHIHYPSRKKENRTTVRCYRLPGNPLSVYDSLRNDGMIKLYKNKPRQIRVVLGDIESNETVLTFSLSRADIGTGKSGETYNRMVPFKDADAFRVGDMLAYIPAGSLDKNLYLTYSMQQGENGKTIYQLGRGEDILFRSARLTFPLTALPDTLRQKAVVMQDDEEEWACIGGSVAGDSIVAYTNTLGEFTLDVDTLSPSITMKGNRQTFRAGEKITFHLSDEYSEPHYDVFVNGQWIIAPYKVMTSELTVPLPDDLPPGEHLLEINATDHRSNRTNFSKYITLLE